MTFFPLIIVITEHEQNLTFCVYDSTVIYKVFIVLHRFPQYSAGNISVINCCPKSVSIIYISLHKMVEYEPNIRPGFHILTLRTFDLITVASTPFFLVLYHLDAYFCFPASFISQTCCKNNLVSIKYTCVNYI